MRSDELHGLGQGAGPADELRIRKRSGWSALDAGVYLGWAYYGDGWLGHNSILPGAPALMRVNPARDVALLIYSHPVPPLTVLARIMGNRFPELLRVRAPIRVGPEEQPLDAHALQGDYANGRTRYALRAISPHQLELQAFERDTSDSSAYATARLSAARENVLIARPPHPRLARFFQLLAPQAGAFQYLWDGEAIFPRCDVP